MIEDAWRSSIDLLGELVFIIPLVNSIIPLGGFGSKPLPISSPVPYTDHRPAVVSTTHTLKTVVTLLNIAAASGLTKSL